LVGHDLLDEVRVMIDPLVVGGGKRLFGDGNPIRALRSRRESSDGHGRDHRELPHDQIWNWEKDR
jgi:RibD C-terminal domain